MSNNKSKLAQLKEMTTVVADTGDFDAIAQYSPEDATTNPSLLLKAAQMPAYRGLVDSIVADSMNGRLSSDEQVSDCMDRLAVGFGQKILEQIPGRVSTEVDARLSFDAEGSIAKARHLINLYEEAGISRNRVLIKMATTWEGIRAAEQLEKEGKFGDAYDTDFRPLNDNPLGKPGDDHAPPAYDSWPLKPAVTNRPLMRSGSLYSTMPKINDKQQTSPVPSPRSGTTAQMPNLQMAQQTQTQTEIPQQQSCLSR